MKDQIYEQHNAYDVLCGKYVNMIIWPQIEHSMYDIKTFAFVYIIRVMP